MNDRGIVRQIDQFGRITLPKEIRKTLNIKDGEDIEITVNSNSIILRPCKSEENLYNSFISQLDEKISDYEENNQDTLLRKAEELRLFLVKNKSKFDIEGT